MPAFFDYFFIRSLLYSLEPLVPGITSLEEEVNSKIRQTDDLLIPAINRAYGCYLQAELAIKERMKNVDYYGDEVVYDKIQKALKETSVMIKDHCKTLIMDDDPMILRLFSGENRRCSLRIKEMEDGVLSINARIMK